jgi:alpha-beta hydrolase superfamily lysophospholipase
MTDSQEWTIKNREGRTRFVSEYPNAKETWIALLVHGYGEHIGRYEHVAEALLEAGAAVLGPDHEGHGRSEGEPAIIEDFEKVVDDVHEVAVRSMNKNPGLPLVLIGHSMGGMIAARYAQRYGGQLAALVLSGPAFGSKETVKQLLAMDPIPEIPIDPAILSRDPSVGEAYAEDPLVWHGPFKRPTLQAMLEAMEAIDAGPNLGDLPTLWIHGEEDLLVPLEQTRPVIQQLRGTVFEQKIYPGARHEVFNEINRDEVIGDVIDFVKRTLAGLDAPIEGPYRIEFRDS